MAGFAEGDRRGLSPIVGTVLLVAVVLLLSVVTAGVIFDATETQQPAPDVAIGLEPTDAPGAYSLVHRSGDTLDGDRFVVRGVINETTLTGRQFTAGRSVVVDPVSERVRLVWFEAGEESSYILAEFDITEVGSNGENGGFGGTLFTGSVDGIKVIEGDGGSVETLPDTSGIAGLGQPDVDVTGDGRLDIPYVTSSGAVKVVDPRGTKRTLATDSDISDAVEYQQTRLASGRWNGSDPSAFFVDQNHATIYRVAPGESPTAVATPGNGAQAVVGVGDIDSDGDDELVFADGSQQLRYLESDGSTHNVDDGQTGSNNGIGSGSLIDVDGDGIPALVAVDGSNEVVVNRRPSGGGTTVFSATDAAKSPPTAADVDGDGSVEVVYVDRSSGELRYIDDPDGSATIRSLNNETGAVIDGSDETGIT